MMDGIGGADLMAEVFDLRADARPPLEPFVWQPQPGPTLAGALAGGLRDALTWPLSLIVGVPALVRQRLPDRNDLAEIARGLHGSAQRLMTPSAGCVNGPTGAGRRWMWTSASLNSVKQIRAEHGGSINDVLLAAVARGFRDIMRRGELSDMVIVRTLVPISIRCPEERGVSTNRLSAAFANLPVAESDPVRRLQLLQDQMHQIKRTNQAVVADY